MIPEPFMPFSMLLIYILIAPVIGGLIAGIDRKVTARMQGRVGPPVLQPFTMWASSLKRRTSSLP